MWLPMGLERSTIKVRPWASMALVFLWAVGHVSVGLGGDEGELKVSPQLVASLVQYWSAHPDLDTPPACASFTRSLEQERHERTVAAIERHGRGYRPPVGDPAHLTMLCERVHAEADKRGWRSWALVPALGLAQRGLVGHLLLNWSWGSLIVSGLLFLLLSAPFLEARWGAPLFVAFFLVAGLLSGVAVLLIVDEGAPMVLGAGGAIAACQGAFTIRLARHRVTFMSWAGHIRRDAGPGRKRVSAPAWAFSVYWLVAQVLLWALTDGLSGRLFIVQMVAFALGGGLALALQGVGVEGRLDLPGAAEERDKSVSDEDDSVATEAAVEALEPAPAAAALDRVDEEPDNRPLIWDFEAPEPDEQGQPEQEPPALELPPAMALPVAAEPPPAPPPAFAVEQNSAVVDLLAAIAETSAPPSAGEPDPAAVVGAARSTRGRRRETLRHDNAHTRGLKADLAEAKFAIRHAEERPALEPLSVPESEVVAPAALLPSPAGSLVSLEGGVAVSRCRLLGRTPDGLVIDCDDGRQLNVPPASILQIAVGMVQVYRGGAATGGPVVVADLVLDATMSGRSLILRFTHTDVALDKIVPQAVNRQAAWTAMMRGLQAESAARRLPEVANWPGPPFDGFRDEAAFEAAFYGP